MNPGGRFCPFPRGGPGTAEVGRSKHSSPQVHKPVLYSDLGSVPYWVPYRSDEPILVTNWPSQDTDVIRSDGTGELLGPMPWSAWSDDEIGVSTPARHGSRVEFQGFATLFQAQAEHASPPGIHAPRGTVS